MKTATENLHLALRLPLLLALLPLSTMPLTAEAQDTTGFAVGSGLTGTERETGYDAAEIEAWNQLNERFDARAREFTQDVRSIVDSREAEERARLNEGYLAMQTELEESEVQLRSMAIRRFEDFLAKYPDAEYSPHVMFRLADLYTEVAKETWLLAADEFAALEETMDDPFEVMELEEPLIDYAPAMALYDRILSDHPDYEYTGAAWYMLGYCFFDPLSSQADLDRAVEAFGRLVDEHPDSRPAVHGAMHLGEFHFDNLDLALAIPYYEKVVSAGAEHELYDKGVYKLAWAHYKLSDYDKSLNLFTDLLDWSEEVYLQSGKSSDLRPEAIKYMAFSFSDLADADFDGRTPVQVAEAWFTQVGAREYEDDVFRSLAEVLEQQARFEDAIESLEYFQDRWPLDPGNPTLQLKVAQLHESKALPDLEAAGRARTVLTERYNPDSAWWQANRNDPDALAVAERFIEQSLADVAIEYHIRAQESQTLEDFAAAADKYREYLSRFPFADDYYEIQWYLADTLYNAQRYEEAQREYERLIASEGHPYKEGSQWMLVQVWRQVVVDTYGGYEDRPNGAVLEKKVPTKDGGERDVYLLTPEHEAMVEAMDLIKGRQFEDPGFAPALDESRAQLYYIPALILVNFGRYEEARPRLEEVIERFPNKDEGAWAANELIATYQADGDYAKIRELTSRFRRMQLGESADVSDDSQVIYETLEEQSAFKLALTLVETGDREGAAKAFVEFMAEFPDSDSRNLALYNAANSYDIVGQKAKALTLFEQYLAEYPQDERSKGLYYRIADNYSQVLDLETAIKYYEDLARYFPDYVDAPDAMFTASFLRSGIGDYEGSAKGYEKYVSKYPDRDDVEYVYWMATKQWKEVGPAQAESSYKKYLSKFGGINPDHTLEAMYYLAERVEEGGRQRNTDKAWDAFLATYKDLAAQGPVGPKARNLAAGIAFRDLWTRYETFAQETYPSAKKLEDPETVTTLLDTLSAEIKLIEQQAIDLITTYQDFEYTSAALYVQGATYWDHAEYLYKWPLPDDWDWELVDAYREQLDSFAEPVQVKAIARLKANLQKSKDEKRSSEWIDKSVAMLNDISPSEYPLEKPEVTGTVQPTILPKVGGISVPTDDTDGGEQ
jgi:cellulose synthase operon protein C